MTEKERALIEKTSRYEIDSRDAIQTKIEEKILLLTKGKSSEIKKARKKRAAIRSTMEEIAYLRGLYVKYTGESLLQFVIDGTYFLTRDGELHKIVDEIPNKNKLPLVVIDSDFAKITAIDGFVTVKSNIVE